MIDCHCNKLVSSTVYAEKITALKLVEGRISLLANSGCAKQRPQDPSSSLFLVRRWTGCCRGTCVHTISKLWCCSHQHGLEKQVSFTLFDGFYSEGVMDFNFSFESKQTNKFSPTFYNGRNHVMYLVLY